MLKYRISRRSLLTMTLLGGLALSVIVFLGPVAQSRSPDLETRVSDLETKVSNIDTRLLTIEKLFKLADKLGGQSDLDSQKETSADVRNREPDFTMTCWSQNDVVRQVDPNGTFGGGIDESMKPAMIAANPGLSEMKSAFEQNPVAAQEKYAGKAFLFTATVQGIQTPLKLTFLWVKESGGSFQWWGEGRIEVTFDDHSKGDVAKLSKGDRIKFKCVFKEHSKYISGEESDGFRSGFRFSHGMVVQDTK